MQRFLLKFEIVLFWLLVLLLAFIPLYPKFPLANIRGTFVAIRIEDLLIFFTLSLWSIHMLLSKQTKKFFTDKLNQSFLLFFFIGGISLFSAVFVTSTVSPNLGVFHYLRRIEYMMLLPMAYSLVKTKKRLVAILIILSAVVFLVNIYALGQRHLDWPVISTGNSEFAKGQILKLTPDARVNSTFAGHYDLAVFLVMVLVILSAIFFNVKNLLMKGWIVVLSGLSGLVLVMTAARLSFVAAVFGITLAFVFIGKRLYVVFLALIVISALVYPSQLRDRLFSTVTVNFQGSGQRYISQHEEQVQRSRLNIPTLPINDEKESSKGVRYSDLTPGEPTNTTQLGVYRSFGIRLDQEWPRAIRALMKNPLLGTGYSSVGIATDNDYLRSLAEVGVLGTLALAFILFEIMKRLWKIISSSKGLLKCFAAGVLSLIFAFTLNALFIDVFEASKVASMFWLISGVGLASERIKWD